MKDKYNYLIIRNLCVVFGILLITNTSQAQFLSKEKKADKLYNELAFFNAAALYEEVIKAGEGSEQTVKHLADSYRKLNEWGKSEYWYGMVTESSIVQPIDFYYYSQALKANGKYEESQVWLQKFAELKRNDSRTERAKGEKTLLTELLTGSENITLSNLEVNTPNSDFGSCYYGKDQIVFASARDDSPGTNPIYKWNNQPFLDLFLADQDKDGELLSPTRFSAKINSPYHEGPATFSPDGTEMYFNRSNYFKRKVGKSTEDVNNLKIYRVDKSGNDWGEIISMPFNSDEYSCGHPSLSPDGQTLYFISDMPGGIGGTDIYYCKREGLAWGNPTNAGPVINTEGSEMFPFIHSDGTLYYSSDGLFGLGGLDIFMAAAREDSTGFEHPINLAKPLNSSSDDFAFIISENKSDGYLSSNREAGKGDDDIYHFKIDFPILEDILDPSNFDDPVANRDSVPTLEGVTDNDIHLGQIYKLENIYYDFDKWNIRPDAQVELIKVIIFMQKFPKVKVELGSHTDCRAPNAYNERLSQRRATSAVNWIVTRGGIDPARITAQGYGERVLTNECADGVHCSEAKHQLNRRTEIKIVEK